MTRYGREFSVGTNRLSMVAAVVALGGLLAAGTGLLAEQGAAPKPKKPGGGVALPGPSLSPEAAAALAPSGFDNETFMSVYDDWEPAVATDPATAYVYQITTRYSGPAACNGCPFPVLVFRSSSNGGTSYGPDRFLNISKNPQNDP
ncbi:MAG TPA: hypothetical protein VGA64_10940, partial [Candidatus Polarisedimenticolia bacterium]